MENGARERFGVTGGAGPVEMQAPELTGQERGVWTQPRVGEIAPDTLREIVEIERKEREGIFSAESPEMDLTGNNQVSDTEEMLYADNLRDVGVKAPNLISFNDRGQEKLSNEAVEAVQQAIEEAGDDMAALNTKIDDLGQTLVLNAYNRRRGDGLKA